MSKQDMEEKIEGILRLYSRAVSGHAGPNAKATTHLLLSLIKEERERWVKEIIGEDLPDLSKHKEWGDGSCCQEAYQNKVINTLKAEQRAKASKL